MNENLYGFTCVPMLPLEHSSCEREKNYRFRSRGIRSYTSTKATPKGTKVGAAELWPVYYTVRGS